MLVDCLKQIKRWSVRAELECQDGRCWYTRRKKASKGSGRLECWSSLVVKDLLTQPRRM